MQPAISKIATTTFRAAVAVAAVLVMYVTGPHGLAGVVAPAGPSGAARPGGVKSAGGDQRCPVRGRRCVPVLQTASKE